MLARMWLGLLRRGRCAVRGMVNRRDPSRHLLRALLQLTRARVCLPPPLARIRAPAAQALLSPLLADCRQSAV